jgi:hypothetical protein
MKASFTARGNFTITSSEATYNIDIIDGELLLTPTGCTTTNEIGKWSLNDASSVLYLEFDISGKDDPTSVEVQIELSDQKLVLKNLPFSKDGSITYTVEFKRK